MAICASPAYLAAYGAPEDFDDLAQHRAVSYFSGRGHRPMPWQIPEGDGTQEIVPKSGVVVNDTEAFIASALAGLGLAPGRGACMASHLATGALVEVLPQAREIRRPLFDHVSRPSASGPTSARLHRLVGEGYAEHLSAWILPA